MYQCINVSMINVEIKIKNQDKMGCHFERNVVKLRNLLFLIKEILRQAQYDRKNQETRLN